MVFRAPARRALTPQGKGRFPGFDVLDQAPHWDDVTSGVVLARLDPPVDFSFFTPSEQATAGALLDQLLAQDGEPKVPVLEMIDQRLALDETDGWFYQDMPEDRQAWRQTLAALDEEAQDLFGARFHTLNSERQGQIVQGVQDSTSWHDLPAGHVWSLWTRYACAAFYSHPWAWNEMGFSGPAYPRGYKNMGVGKLEGYERREEHPSDPVPWSQRVEQARRQHEATTGKKKS